MVAPKGRDKPCPYRRRPRENGDLNKLQENLMNIIERLNEEMKTAMREKQTLKLSVIRMVKAALKYAEIDKKDHKLEEADILQVLQKEAKKRKEAAEEFKKGNRPELEEKELKELKIIEEYLPKQMAKEEIEEEIKKILAEIPDDEKANIGKVMGKVMPVFKGRADGALVNQLVKALMGQ